MIHSDFYPRSPCGERPRGLRFPPLGMYFYPRSPCGERRCLGCLITSSIPISIHALLAESDAEKLHKRPPPAKFLSTLSLRRATACHPPLPSCPWNFYPRSPCGERLFTQLHFCVLIAISIHALLAESDEVWRWSFVGVRPFLSTLSLRRATPQHAG